MNKEQLAHLSLRIAVAFAFIYPPVAAFLDPYSWIGYFPSFMRGFVPDVVLLHGFGFIETVIALWILSGRRIFLPSLGAALILLAIVLFDHNNFDVLFRDLSIAGAALSLAILAYPQRAS